MVAHRYLRHSHPGPVRRLRPLVLTFALEGRQNRGSHKGVEGASATLPVWHSYDVCAARCFAPRRRPIRNGRPARAGS
jgi:hypothetical protein